MRLYLNSMRPAPALLFLVLVAGASWAGTDEFAALFQKKGPAAREVVERPTLYRVAEMSGLPCTPAAFEFLLDRPRLSMVLARQADPGLDGYKIEARPDGSYHVDDRGRLVGDMEVVSREDGKRVYFISGHWKFILGMRFDGRMVLVPEYYGAKDGGRGVDARARGYMKVDSALVGVMAKAVFYVFPGKVDARIGRFASAVRKVAEAVNDDPEGVYRKLLELKEAPPEEVEEYRAAFVGRKSVRKLDGGGGI